MNKGEAVKKVLDAIVDTVADAGDTGAPSGILYAGLMAGIGISLETYEGIMNLLVMQGRITKEGHVYYIKKA